MTRAELRRVIEVVAGDRLTGREVALIFDAAIVYATGDTWELQCSRRHVLGREAAAAYGRGHGRREARGARPAR